METEIEQIAKRIKRTREGQKQYGDWAVGAVDAVAMELAEQFSGQTTFPGHQKFLKMCGVLK